MNNPRDRVKEFMRERGWEKQLPDHVAKSIAIEAAELLELFQWSTPTAKEIQDDPEKFAELKGELADVFIYSLQMSLILNLDIDEIVKNKLAFADKKYPAHLMRKRSAGETLATKKYLEIKKAYRQKKKN